MTAPENVQAARFYGEVFGLPTWTDGGVGEEEVGLSVLLFYPGPAEPGACYCVSRSPKTALLRRRPGSGAGSAAGAGRRRVRLRSAVELPVPLLRRDAWDSGRSDRTTRPTGGVVGPIHQRRLVAHA